jgi:dTDP-4-amino-4,6-dideoxygalactose transaminase
MYRIGQEELDEIGRLFRSKRMFRADTDLHEVENLEKEWAEAIGVKYAVAVTGGTSALICALVGLGIGPGDEVIVPGYTFMASATAVLAVGAIPVLAEVDETLAIDPGDVENKIGPHTRAVMPVHMLGRPANMGRILEIAKRKGILVVEDACQADGGSYHGRRLGSLGHAGAFSFNFYKIISAGEGGAVVSDNRKVYERALIHHDSGIAFRFSAKDLSTPVFLGQQYRMSEILGAVLRMQLRKLDPILADLRRAQARLREPLSRVPGARILGSNDPEGDCGQVLGLQFDSERRARAFAGAAGVKGSLPIDSDKHVYSNWSPILEKRGAHHPALDPFRLPQNRGLRMDYRGDMCPRTLDFLRRTVFLSMNPDWTKEEIADRTAACRAGLEKALS